MASKQPPLPDPDWRFPHWQAQYEAVLSETDRRILFKRVEVAEAALRNRRDALQGPEGQDEEREIGVALEKLRAVKQDIFPF